MSLTFPSYTRGERIADAVVHVLGVGMAVIAGAVLLAVAVPGGGAQLAALGLYVFGVVAGLGFSAAYNLVSSPGAKSILRRFDHAAIFLMIAGSYTPFAAIAIGGFWGAVLLSAVWVVAIGGVALKLALPGRFERLSIVLYLMLGWAILPAMGPVIDALSGASLVLLLVGGGLYSLGVVFHLWHRLPYHNAIWHGFVLAAAVCHYIAVMRDGALRY
jgi:hemolysin III